MSPSCRSTRAPSSRKRLVACVIAILGLPASAAFAGTVIVNNCNDSGTGSLRWAVGPTVAASGDSIDMTGLTAASAGCADSRITLSTGEIPVLMYDLTIQGPGVNNLEVSGNNHSRIFHHYGTGRLTVRNLAISSGYASGTYPTGAASRLSAVSGCTRPAFTIARSMHFRATRAAGASSRTRICGSATARSRTTSPRRADCTARVEGRRSAAI